MARKKSARGGGITKSQAVRDQLGKTPNASAAEVAQAASEASGLKIEPVTVYNIRSTEGFASPRKGRKRGRPAKRASTAAASSNGGMDIGLVKQAAQLLSQAGDAATARRALDAANELSKVFAK